MRNLLLWYIPQAALFCLAIGAASSQTVSKPLVDRFVECSIAAFVDFEFGKDRPDPEQAFARCSTEEQQILSAISFIRSERTQRLAYALFIKRKADLKAEMLQMAAR